MRGALLLCGWALQPSLILALAPAFASTFASGLALAALPHEEPAPSPQDRNAPGDAAADLERLIVAPPAEGIPSEALAALLLGERHGAIARWLDSLDAALDGARDLPERRRALEHLRASTRETPARITAMLEAADLPEGARAHALTVGLIVLGHWQRPASFRHLQDLLASAPDLAAGHAAAPAAALQTLITEFTSLRLYSPADLAHLFGGAPAPLALAIVDGVSGGAGAAFTAEALGRLLGVRPAADPAVLNRLHLALLRDAREDLSPLADDVAPFLEDPRPFARHEAAACLGRVGERSHVELLIGRLTDGDAAVRGAARDALCQLTGMALPADARRWRTWFDGQLEWWSSDGADRLTELARVARPQQLVILRDACTKRLFHEEVAIALVPLLEGGDVEEQRLALSALGTLRSPTAVALVEAFVEHPEPTLRAAAEAAMRSYRQGRACVESRGDASL